MPNLFALIGESWGFARKQPVVWQTVFWLIFLPATASQILLLADRNGRTPETALLVLLANILLVLLTVWGGICLLVIGKRMLQAKSGRSRTSFKVVRTEASKLFIPFVLTSVLATIITVLWGLLLIVPGIIYLVRTVFYQIIVVDEGIAYRPALRRSIDITRGRFWQVAGTIAGLSLLILLPTQIINAGLHFMAKDLPLPALVSATVAEGILAALATMLYTFALIPAYRHFRPVGHVTNR